MKETVKSHSINTAHEKLPAPKGIGMAVAFDWGLTVELLAGPVLLLFFGLPENYQQLNMSPTLVKILSFVFLWPIAVFFAIFGDGVRSGRRWTRPLQIAGNTLGFLGGFFLLVPTWQAIKAGNYLPLVPAIILLIFSPLIAWRLSRPSTARWFAMVSTEEARKRHGGSWMWLIALWAIVGGLLVAWGAFKR